MAHRIRSALLFLPLALLLAALLDTPYHAVFQGQLWGTFWLTTRPKVSVTDLWSGKFQTEFEGWLEQQLSLKPVMVRTDNSLNLALFRDISAHTGIGIVLGEQHTLFEMNYVNNHNAVSEYKADPPPRSNYSVEQSTRLVARAARAFRLLGVDFMVVFYPSKADILSQRLKPSFVLPGGAARAAAGYHDLLRRLRDQGVPVVDGNAVFSKITREAPQFPLYNSGGTHWTDAGACEVSKQIVGNLPLANLSGSTLSCRLGRESPAQGGDLDLSQLINVWDNSRFIDPIPVVVPVLSAPLTGGPRDALIVGTSYSDHLTRLLHQAGVFREVARLTYYRHANLADVDWRRNVAHRRVVIFEQCQWSYFTINITEFLDDMTARVPHFAKALREVDAMPATSVAP